MEVNELRSGNWIDTKDFHIDEFKGLYQYDPEWYKYVHMFEPIPLTEEWLIKFGFRSIGKNEYDASLETYVLGDFGDFSIEYERDEFCQFLCNDDSYTIRYVHELQNSYWCLCGKELELLH